MVSSVKIITIVALFVEACYYRKHEITKAKKVYQKDTKIISKKKLKGNNQTCGAYICNSAYELVVQTAEFPVSAEPERRSLI